MALMVLVILAIVGSFALMMPYGIGDPTPGMAPITAPATKTSTPTPTLKPGLSINPMRERSDDDYPIPVEVPEEE